MMRSDGTVRQALEKAVSQSPTESGLLAVRQAAALAVMIEQIEYLAGHAVEACPSECPDCARLEQVNHWLLAPFR